MSASRAIVRYVVLAALIPVALFALAFAVLCAIECTVLPWYSLIAGPVAGLVALVILGAVNYAGAARFGENDRRTIRILVLTSIFWAPLLAMTVGGIAIGILQVVLMII